MIDRLPIRQSWRNNDRALASVGLKFEGSGFGAGPNFRGKVAATFEGIRGMLIMKAKKQNRGRNFGLAYKQSNYQSCDQTIHCYIDSDSTCIVRGIDFWLDLASHVNPRDELPIQLVHQQDIVST